MSSRELSRIVMVGIMLIVSAFHLWDLPRTPTGLWYDEAYNGMDAAWMLRSRRPQVFFVRSTGREAMVHYFQALAMSVLGPNPSSSRPITSGPMLRPTFALRLPMALLSLLAIPLMYQWMRILFSGHAMRGEWWGVVGAANLGFSFWHLTMSRSGYRVSLVITFSLLTGYLFWRGWRHRRLRYFVGAGIALGLSQYTYPTARFLPFVYGGFWLLVNWRRDEGRFRLRWEGLVLMAGASLAIFAPLAIFFLHYPDAFSERATQVLITHRLRTGDITLATHIRNVVGAFVGGWDKNWRHGLVGVAGFETLNLIMFWVGVGVILTEVFGAGKGRSKKINLPKASGFLRKEAQVWEVLNPGTTQGRVKEGRIFLLLNFGIAWLPAWITADESVQAWRLAMIFPAYYAVATRGLIAAATWLRPFQGNKPPQNGQFSEEKASGLEFDSSLNRRWLGIILSCALLLNGTQTAYRYFGRWADHPQVYEAFEGPHVDFVRELIARSFTEDLLAPFYLYEYPTTRFLFYDRFEEVENPATLHSSDEAAWVRLREAYDLKNMTVDKHSPYVWLTQAGQAYLLSEAQTDLLVDMISDKDSQVASSYRSEIVRVEGLLKVQQQLVADYEAIRRLDATWGETLHLSGYRLTPQLVSPGTDLTLNLYWRSDSHQPVRDKLFVHIIDSQGSTKKIWDAPIFETTLSRWRDYHVRRVYKIPLAPDMPEGTYVLRVGVFDPETETRLKLEDERSSGEVMVLGPVYVTEEGEDPRLPHYRREVVLGDKAKLRGYRTQLVEDHLRVSLVWEALKPMCVDYTVFVHGLDKNDTLVTSHDAQPLNGVYPTSHWEVGQVIVDTWNLPLPAEGAQGEASIVDHLGVGWYDLSTMERVPAFEHGERLANDVIVLTAWRDGERDEHR